VPLINYVEIEVLENKTKNSYKGLLKAFELNTKLINSYINISKHVDSSAYYYLDNYKIVAIKIAYDNKYTRQTFFKTQKQEQNIAFALLKTTITFLKEQGNVDASEAIIFAKYKDVPKEYICIKDNTTKQKPKNATNYQQRSRTYNVYTKPKKEITYIRRRTKKPSKDFLTKMKNSVKLISSNEYEAKPLPTIKNEAQTKQKAQTDYYKDDLWANGEFGYMQ
jgi:hypothetical protein